MVELRYKFTNHGWLALVVTDGVIAARCHVICKQTFLGFWILVYRNWAIKEKKKLLVLIVILFGICFKNVLVVHAQLI